jgi:aminoglycoside N3'-acetyltransferase
LIKSLIKTIKSITLTTVSRIQTNVQKRLIPYRSRNFINYDSAEFKQQLKLIGIYPGDSIFIMHSQDKIYLRSGKIISPQQILSDLIDYLGSDGTVMVLGFSLNGSKILAKESLFDVNKTATDCGILAETLRRKKGSVRSIQPFFSAIAYGKEANNLCADHHKSPYPFDKCSPYYRLTQNGGKYLGIGVGFEAFTPCHMVDDYYKEKFKHLVYYDTPEKFIAIDRTGAKCEYEFFTRNPKTYPGSGVYDPHNYFRLLDIPYCQTITQSGVKLFTFQMSDFLDAAVRLYDSNGKTVWDTGSILFTIHREFRQRIYTFLN